METCYIHVYLRSLSNNIYSFNQTIVSPFVSFKVVILAYTPRFQIMFGHGNLV